jgi:hypothetical protein
MIIRATAKLLKTSKIQPIKNSDKPNTNLPGEWYASLVSMGRPGKLTIHFLHYPSMITILIPGKSLNKALKLLPFRCESLLNRINCPSLINKFQLNQPPQTYTTNSRSMLAHMTQIKFTLEIHLSEAMTDEEIDWDKLEDIYANYLLTRNKAYFKPIELLKNLLLDKD